MLREVIAELSLADRGEVERRLQLLQEASGVCLQAVQNFYAESRLSAEAWRALIDAVLRAPATAPETRGAITHASRAYQLNGPALGHPQPARFSRAITVDALCRLLVEMNYFATVQTAKRAVRNALGQRVRIVAHRWRNFSLGRFLMWCTFEPSGDHSFQHGERANRIRGVLGLDPQERGRNLILLDYTLPASFEPRFPTVADAYSGQCWFYFFRPAPRGAVHGLTMPWPEYSSEPPKPEAVHEVIQGRQLSGIREVLS